MKKSNWILLIVTFSIFIIVNAPASLLSSFIYHVSHGKVELANTEGTVWKGVGNPVLHEKNGRLISLNALRWNIEMIELLIGHLKSDFYWDVENSSFPMNVTISVNKIELSHAIIPLPAILLDEASDFLKPAALRGQIILKSDSLILTKGGINGTATADWLNASSLLTNISPLGDYHFTFTSSLSGLDITLMTTSGALILAGHGKYLASEGLTFNGTAQPSPGNESALHELLSNLGPEVSPGVNSFSLVPSRTKQ